MLSQLFIALSISCYLLLKPLQAEQLTLCSQNLKLFGSEKHFKSAARAKKIAARISSANCDIVALQELMGENENNGEKNLDILLDTLNREYRGVFTSGLLATKTSNMQTPIIYDQKRFKLLKKDKITTEELPKLSKRERPRKFQREPILYRLLDLKSRGTFVVINFHSKAKVFAGRDPSGTSWETYRMQMAEQLRQVVEAITANSSEPIFVVGDLNADPLSSSIDILTGKRKLRDFELNCVLSKSLKSWCSIPEEKHQTLIAVTEFVDKKTLEKGTYVYKGKTSWIDQIFVNYEHSNILKIADTGVVWEPKDASDHALIYIKTNF